METCFNYINEHAYFSSDERRWITKIHKLKESNPDDVFILAEPEDNGGCIYCRLPPKWLKISPPAQRNFTDEQRAALAERLKTVRQK